MTLFVIAGFGLSLAALTSNIPLPSSSGVGLAAEGPILQPRITGVPAPAPLSPLATGQSDVRTDSVAESEPAPLSSAIEAPPALAPAVAPEHTALAGVVAHIPQELPEGVTHRAHKSSARHARSKHAADRVARRQAHPPPARANAPRDEKAESVATGDDSAPHAQEEPGEPGLLRINSRPWAEIFVDGRSRGSTPNLGMPLQPGIHTVKLVNSTMGMSKSFDLKIRSGTIVTKVLNLGE